MKDRHSLVGISADGQKTTLCINVGSEAEAERLAATLRTVGDYVRIEVVVETAIGRPQPWIPPPIDLEQVVQRRKQLSRRKPKDGDDQQAEESASLVVARNPSDSGQQVHNSRSDIARVFPAPDSASR